jgi:hypothetical protein
MVWDMSAELPESPLCPGPSTPYMPYSTARNRFGRMLDYLGVTGAHTHSLRHQFASEALDANPRELANISQVLGHDSIETPLRFYIHPRPPGRGRKSPLTAVPQAPARRPVRLRRTRAENQARKAKFTENDNGAARFQPGTGAFPHVSPRFADHRHAAAERRFRDMGQTGDL